MKIKLIFPGRKVEMGKAAFPVMPLAPTLLAALTPPEHDIQLIDMFYDDELVTPAIEGTLTILKAA